MEPPGRKGEPDALVLRTPQLTEAVANAKATQAQVEKAKRDLQRTEIVAPYDARIRQKRADVGQTVSPGTLLAEVFALEAAEVTLSLTQREFSALGFQANMDTSTPEVTVVFDADGNFSEGSQWSGLVVRTGAEIDPATRRIPVVARIVLAEQSAPLHMGQFLQARLTSRTPYENTWAVPNQAIRGDNTLFLVTSENTLKVAQPKIVWRGEVTTLTQASTTEPVRLCLTPPALAMDGVKVAVKGDPASLPMRSGGGKSRGAGH